MPSPPFTHQPTGLLATVLALSPTATALLQPVYAADATLQDFAWAYLNAAGQQQLQLPKRPAVSWRSVFPVAELGGPWEACRQAYLTSSPVEGHSGPWQLMAQRHEELLVVCFTAADTASDGTTSGTFVADALRESQADELAARAEAEQQRQRFQEVLTQLPAYVAVYQGPDHIYQFVNPLYQSRFPHRSFLGRPFREGTPESVELGVVDIFDRVYQTGKPFYLHEMEGWFDFLGTGKPEQIYLNLILQPLRDAQGHVSGVLDFSYSVTEQVRARQKTEQLNQELEARVLERTSQLAQAHRAAEQQRAQLDALFMQAPAAIGVLNGPEWVFELVNPIYQSAFPGRALLGLPLLAVLPELNDSVVPDILSRVYLTGEAFQATELPVRLARTADGPVSDRFWSFTFQPRRNEQGRVDGVLVFGYDVTETLQARQAVEASQRHTQGLLTELQTANTELIRVNAYLDHFVYTASHDLKAPIINIEGLLQVLREELALPPAEADTATMLRLMDDSVHRFQHTLRQLTDVTKLQQPLTSAVPVDIRAVLADIELDLHPLLAASGGQIVLASDSCPTILVPEKHLRSLLYNFISNGLKYCHPDRVPLVQVQCRADAATTVLEVTDNGLGLTPAQQEQVFGLFQRQHSHVEGSGVGLYLVKQLVEAAGGQVELDSQYGVGSTFRVLLPNTSAAGSAFGS